MKKYLFGILTGLIIAGTTVYAANQYFARDIKFSSSKTTKTNIQDAIDELYDKANSASSGCPAVLLGMSWNFNYTGKEEKFVVPCKGIYKIEVWGASGGTAHSKSIGGAGAYAKGNASLNASTQLFINVGGQGIGITSGTGGAGYNGGGSGVVGSQKKTAGGGGGATSVTLTSGVISSHVDENGNPKLSELLIIAAGGGGAGYYGYTNATNINYSGGNAGGIIGNDGIFGNDNYPGTGGTQTAGGANDYKEKESIDGSFGQGGTGCSIGSSSAGGGGGLYGGGGSCSAGGGGGSSYVGNLSDKEMYCLNCTPSTNPETKTTTVTDKTENPEPGKAKLGDGYVKITLVGTN